MAKAAAAKGSVKIDGKVTASQSTAKKAKKASTPAPEKEATPEAPTAPTAKSAKRSAPEGDEVAPLPKKLKSSVNLNTAPSQILDIYVWGENSAGECGLGATKYDGKSVSDITRPRINHLLTADRVGVVQVAAGGMHCAALTHDNRILTWGVNDQGALGRDTTWDGGYEDIDAADKKANGDGSDSDSDDDEPALNPHESTPGYVDMKHFHQGAKITKVACGDSTTFALTHDGCVYGWGTFRASDGILGFSMDVREQRVPTLMKSLKNITDIAVGLNHALAMNNTGKVYTWGCGEQNQLGRRVIERRRKDGLTPSIGFSKKAAKIACGSNHNFVIDNKGMVHSWGLNTYCQTGTLQDIGKDNAAVLHPTIVEGLKGYNIADIAGGEHHSLAATKDGKLLVWGRCDGGQAGIALSSIPKTSILDDHRGAPRMIKVPFEIPSIRAASVGSGTDTSYVVDTEGKLYSWGFSANYQTGLGRTEEDEVSIATLVSNAAINGKKLIGAQGGGQFALCYAAHVA